MITLDARLKAVLNEIHGHILVDVGCDHGKVSCKAILENKVEKVIATDISKPSLEKARKLAKKYNLTNIEFRAGDGLKVIKDNEADIVLIAGMGGYEIIKILNNIPKGIENFVLVAHTNVSELREFLVNNNISIQKDYIIECSNHFYSIIVAKNGIKKNLTKKELLLGFDSIENIDYKNYLLYLIDKYNRVLKNNVPQNIVNEIKENLSLIKEELNEG